LDVLDYFARLKGMKGPGVRRKAQDALDAVGLGEWGKKRVDALSKGMQQKVQIVGTLLHDPEVIVLDEPFAGLDPLNARMVKEIIQGLKREGRLVVLSTHQMDQVEELCDRIVMIDRGKRVLYGTVREIKKTYAAEIRKATGRGNVVVVDGEGPLDRVQGVLASETTGGELRLTLDPAVTPEAYLQSALAAGCTIARFEAAPTPLEEIFVHVATREGAAA